MVGSDVSPKQYWVLGLGIKFFGFWVWVLGLGIKIFGHWVLGLGIKIFGYWVLGLGIYTQPKPKIQKFLGVNVWLGS